MRFEMSGPWKTKYGLRRVKHDPPTLEEAIFAARGLSDDPQHQIEIAASLMGASLDDVRAAMRKSAGRTTTDRVTFTKRGGAERAVIVERRSPRRVTSRKTLA
jgi:hypothetical protein